VGRKLRQQTSFCLVIVAALLGPRTAWAQSQAVASISGERAVVRVDQATDSVHRLRCLDAQCTRTSPAGQWQLGVAPFADTGTQVQVVPVEASQALALVRARGASGREVSAVIGARGEPVFLGQTGYTEGLVGERRGVAITTVDRGDGTQVVVLSQLREDQRLCGQVETPLDPKGLDPRTMEFRGATLQRLSVAERTAAQTVIAVARAQPSPPPLAPVLRPAFASGNTNARALVDGDLASAWQENRPGDGRGEFAVLRGDPGLMVSRIGLVLSRAGATTQAPKSLYLLFGEQRVLVRLPGDAVLTPGAVYDVPLPQPMRAECLAVVLDQVYGSTEAPDTAVYELSAYTPLDTPDASLKAVAAALALPAQRPLAQAVLRAAGAAAVPAIQEALPSLDAAARKASFDSVAGLPCDESSRIFALGLADPDKDVAALADARLQRCGAHAAAGLVAVLSDARRGLPAARLLGLLAPARALIELPKHLGSSDPARRRALRSALGTAVHRASDTALAAALKDLPPAEGPARVDLLMTLAPRLVELHAESLGTEALNAYQRADFDDRYRLLDPIVAVAASDPALRDAIARRVATSEAWEIRARTAALLSQQPWAEALLAKLAGDAHPRVRESALQALDASRARAGRDVALARLRDEPWTFVRLQAATVLRNQPLDAALGALLVESLGDKSPQVRAELVDVVAKHSRRPVARLAELATRQAEDLEVRRRAILALAVTCDASRNEDLTDYVRLLAFPTNGERDAVLGAAAIDALAGLGPSDLATRLAVLKSKGAPAELRRVYDGAMAAPPRCKVSSKKP
jgi:hypothetical protein